MDSIRIDYDHIDVADIMNQIKSEIAARPAASAPKLPAEPPEGQTVPTQQPPPPELPGPRSRFRRVMLKIMRPVAPAIKLLVLPVHEELRQTILSLDQTNRRLDLLRADMEKEIGKLRSSVEVSVEDANQRVNETNNRVDEAFVQLGRRNDYVKLLHNLSHNIVVELTKLKIEEETLKTKTRIMEKDFEFLQKREKALEKLTLR